jgi:hypothetical protein
MKYKALILTILVLFLLPACQPASIPTAVETIEQATGDGTTAASTDAPTAEPTVSTQGDGAASPVLSREGLHTDPLEQDVIQEIAVFGGAGGGSGHCAGVKKKTPTLWGAPENPTELMQVISFEVCNLEPDEEITMRVTKPDGQTYEAMQAAYAYPDGPTVAEFEYQPRPEDPPGLYLFDIGASGWSLDYEHEVQAPASARLYLQDHKLYLLGFPPGEQVQLLVYQEVDERGNYMSLSRLAGWAEYQVNNLGRLQMEVDPALGLATFVALGAASGPVYLSEVTPALAHENYAVFCPGAPGPVGIHPGGQAELLVDAVPAYQIKVDPASGAYSFKKVVNPLPQGSVAGIISNAYCVDNQYVWGVDCGSAYAFCDFFLAEAGPEGPYLRPVGAASSAVSTSQANSIPACPGTEPSRLQVGMNAEVTTSGAAPQLSLRAQPSMEARQAHVIAAGRDLVILDGPVCAENSYWWLIRSEQGYEGWSREGDNKDYWIDPLP